MHLGAMMHFNIYQSIILKEKKKAVRVKIERSAMTLYTRHMRYIQDIKEAVALVHLVMPAITVAVLQLGFPNSIVQFRPQTYLCTVIGCNH